MSEGGREEVIRLTAIVFRHSIVSVLSEGNVPEVQDPSHYVEHIVLRLPRDAYHIHGMLEGGGGGGGGGGRRLKVCCIQKSKFSPKCHGIPCCRPSHPQCMFHSGSNTSSTPHWQYQVPLMEQLIGRGMPIT